MSVEDLHKILIDFKNIKNLNLKNNFINIFEHFQEEDRLRLNSKIYKKYSIKMNNQRFHGSLYGNNVFILNIHGVEFFIPKVNYLKTENLLDQLIILQQRINNFYNNKNIISEFYNKVFCQSFEPNYQEKDFLFYFVNDKKEVPFAFGNLFNKNFFVIERRESNFEILRQTCFIDPVNLKVYFLNHSQMNPIAPYIKSPFFGFYTSHNMLENIQRFNKFYDIG